MSFDENAVLEFYENLPSDTTSNFSKEITNFVIKYISHFDNGELEKYLEDKIKVSSSDLESKFSNFYTLVVYYRRTRSYTKLGNLINAYSDDFLDKPLFLFAKSDYELNQNTKQSYDRALILAGKCIDIIKNKDNNYDSEYTGFYNHYATIIVAYLEKKYEISRSEIDLAYSYIEKCIKSRSDYATYYVTLARLELSDKKFENAYNHILQAIDIEKDRGRITEYNDLLLKVEYERALKELSDESNKVTLLIKENEKRIEENKTNTIEYLAFFSGVIAFLVTSANMAVSNPSIAFKLILTMLGALIIGFSSFSILIQRDNKKIFSIITAIIIGILLIVISNRWLK